MATVQLIGSRCFPLLMKNVNHIVRKATIQDDVWNWRKRLGHLKFTSLKLLKQKEMV